MAEGASLGTKCAVIALIAHLVCVGIRFCAATVRVRASFRLVYLHAKLASFLGRGFVSLDGQNQLDRRH